MAYIKLKLSDDLYRAFKKLHPGYGEQSRVFKELVEDYVYTHIMGGAGVGKGVEAKGLEGEKRQV